MYIYPTPSDSSAPWGDILAAFVVLVVLVCVSVWVWRKKRGSVRYERGIDEDPAEEWMH